jgi:hypothetical protein
MLLCLATGINRSSGELYTITFFTSAVRLKRFRKMSKKGDWQLDHFADEMRFYFQDGTDGMALQDRLGGFYPPFAVCKRYETLLVRCMEHNMDRYTALEVRP